MSKGLSIGVFAATTAWIVAGAPSPTGAQSSSSAGEVTDSSATAAAAPNAMVMLESKLCRIDIREDRKNQWMRLPRAEASVTTHRLNVAGKSFDYTATAGTEIVRDDQDKPIASIGYVAYVAHEGKGGAARPITFAFNGGPGSSSLWLHMGVLGPKRVVVSDPNPTPPAPYHTVDNQYGLLDKE